MKIIEIISEMQDSDNHEKTFQIINNIREDPVGYADIIEDSMKYIMEEEDTKDPSKKNLIFKKKSKSIIK